MTQSPARTTGVYGPSGAVDFAGAEDFFVAFFAVFFTVFFAVFFAVAILPAYRATASERK
jgi:preprotein translocase subunit SecG